MSTGGSVESVSVAGRTFSVPADSEYQVKLGGWENEIQPNGDGTSRLVKTRVPWSLTGGAVSVDDDNGDLEFLQERADSSRFEVCTITLTSGAVYQGTGIPAGEIQKSTQSTTASVDFIGQGKLTKQ
jgi:hypothetical protein